jgi:type I restriction enzyme R subunit
MWQTADRTRRSRRFRRRLTVAEDVFWSLVRSRRLDGLKFRRQAPVAGSICDFVCLELALVVKLDGGVHALRDLADQTRDDKLRAAGFTVLRSGNEAFMTNPNSLIDAIKRHAACTPRRPPHPSGSAAHLLPRGEKDSEFQT